MCDLFSIAAINLCENLLSDITEAASCHLRKSSKISEEFLKVFVRSICQL